MTGKFSYFSALQYSSGVDISYSTKYPRVPRLIDWNGDDKHDLLIGSGGYVYLHINTGLTSAPSFSSGVLLRTVDGKEIYSGDDWSTFTLADMDGDGVVDLILKDYYTRLCVYKNTARSVTPTFALPFYVMSDDTGKPLVLPDRRFDIGDWNNDGFQDVLSGITCGDVYLYVNSKSSSSISCGTGIKLFSSQCNSWYPRLYDVNQDGIADLIRGVYGGISYWLDPGISGIASSSAVTVYNSGGSLVNIYPVTHGAIIEFGDLNNDGQLDVLIGGHGKSSDKVYVAYGGPGPAPVVYPTIAPTLASPTINPTLAPTVPTIAPTPYPGSSWTTIYSPAIAQSGVPLLLTDGTVMIVARVSFKLTPDIYGDYTKGNWTTLATMPLDYDPLYFASAVLPDGRVVVAGGEYNAGINNYPTSRASLNAAIYDPIADRWTIIPSPSTCSSMGDSPSVVLADGRWMVGSNEKFLFKY